MLSAPTGKWQSLNNGMFDIDKMDDEHLAKAIGLIENNLANDRYDHPIRVSTKEASIKLRELHLERRRRK